MYHGQHPGAKILQPPKKTQALWNWETARKTHPLQAEKLLTLEDTKVLTEQRYEQLKQRQHQVIKNIFNGTTLGGLRVSWHMF